MQQTSHGQNGGSLLILVFDGPLAGPRGSGKMTKLDDDPTDENTALRGWSFVGAIVLTAVLGGAYVVWKYYKHHVLFPWLGPDMWIVYAVGVVVLLAWGIGTRFGTKQ